ncbi:SCP-like extracellular protein [Alkaliphilus metalliredigens QYMF]|uniref:SCP-like extracellular protein n=1 Tax=Alkaliphilus metalliredigens (strain QYMF) TaxID=293826 RepID=A6TTP0_ALKMQ|nr:CAP domain-containing protein [Alkaliphilus metalliredigens]ABR49558.1 SCP-like extracellular protein [Alkaliphilus metalliredigens QYMF]
MKNLLKKIVTITLVMVFLSQVTTTAYASWGLQRRLQDQNKTISTAPSTPNNIAPQGQPQAQRNTYAPSPSVAQESNQNQSTADLIRGMRNNPSASQSNTTTTNNTNNNPAPLPSQPTPPVSNQTNLSGVESTMLDMINQERREHGLSPLKLHVKLTDVARVKSQDIVDNNYFAHTSPIHGSFYQMVSNAGISYRQVGENLAKAGDVRRAHMMLMGSIGHRNNILSESFTHIGIGISRDSHGIVVTQLFIRQ